MLRKMVQIGCPFCTRLGIGMVIIGLAFVMISVLITVPWLAIIGLVVLLSAYIVPSLIREQGCHETSCARPAKTPGADEKHE